MRYVMLFVETEEFEEHLASLGPEDRAGAFDLVNKWMAEHADRIRGGSKLQSAHTATTVRLGEVLAVIYLVFNEGYLASDEGIVSPSLVEDAEWVAAQLQALMPSEPEAAGLLALIRLHRARAGARFSPDGDLVLLADQDRSRWDRAAIADADRLLVGAARLKRPGPYQLQAAIVACHAQAPTFEETDWEQIVLPYDMLLRLAPSPVTRLHGAVALRYATNPQAALDEIEGLAAALDGYHLFHATRAQLLQATGRHHAARDADRRALALTTNPAEKAVLLRRLSGHDHPVPARRR